MDANDLPVDLSNGCSVDLPHALQALRQRDLAQFELRKLQDNGATAKPAPQPKQAANRGQLQINCAITNG